ncbi:ATP-binding protein [Calothrix sp. PCC 7507]|uniref:ATP-binding protein n=1 Tax=Calothrix sp. PCC 7507 TaxID=99598 RepID=UPI00029F2882|nr:ATP-binding protein [Calothrix sp. PCC 7507]AFY34556.1 multi-sensor hybrid histidine kinase [Calothrix sp. PCC 7507]
MLKVNRLWLRNIQPIHVHSLVVTVASWLVILVGISVLLGWCFEIEFLKNGFYASNVTMKANSGLCFVLSGISLWLLQNAGSQRRILGLGQNGASKEKKNYPRQSVLYFKLARVCALLVLITGLLTFSQYLFGWNLGIDELLFRDWMQESAISSPGRMGLKTALNFIFVGIGLELLVRKKSRRNYWYAQIISLMIALIAFQSLIAYAYKVELVYGLLPQTTSMALPTALTFLVLCIGMLWTHPHQGLMRVVTSDSYGGLFARRLLLAAIAVPFLVGWLIVKGQQAKQYDAAFAISLFAIVLIVIFAIVVWQSAAVVECLSRQHDRIQDALRANEAKLRSFVDANIVGIAFGNADGTIQQANDAFLSIIGYTQEDLIAGQISWHQLTPPEQFELDWQKVTEAKENANGACLPYEKEYIRRDGSRVPVLVGYVLLAEKRQETVTFILDLSAQQAALRDRQQARAEIVQLNKNLQRRVAELQTLLDVIPIGIGIAEDPQCQNIKVNPAFAKQLGISPNLNASLSAPIDERPTFKIYREGRELRPEELPMQYSAAEGVEVLDFEIDVVHENGKIVKVLEYVAPLFDEEGQTRGCIGAFLDITERKQAEEVLRNQQKWLEDVLNLMPRPLLFIEPATAKVTFANRAANELAGGEFPRGIPAAEYHKFYYYSDANGDRIPNDQMPGVRVARGERLNGLEVDWHTVCGVRSLLIFADTLPAMHGHPATCVMVFQEITNLKQAEKALSLGYKRLQILFDTASELLSSQHPVALIDSLFRKLSEQIGLDVYFNYLVEENSQLMHLASSRGISQEQAAEIEWIVLGQAICGSAALERHAIAVENVQQSTDPKTELIRTLGVTAYYAYPLIAQGQLLGTLSFGSRTRTRFTENQKGMMQAVCDQIAIAMERAGLIASLQQQTEELRAANRMKDEFLAILSHELRSPLNAILGWAQLLRSRNLSETQISKALETIERNARTQTQLVEDLLDISRMIRGQLRLNVRTCDLMLMIESVLETVSLAAQAKEIDLTFSLIPWWEPQVANNEHPESIILKSKIYRLSGFPKHSALSEAKDLNSKFLVVGDPERLQQIIWNLLSNAIKFTPRGGGVEIKLSKTSGNEQEQLDNITDYAQIQVLDTGIGISSEFLPYVFDRFRQADSSSTRPHGGLGLGLAIVRHLVELHGGTIHVDSQGEQQGAIFTVKLPLLSPNSSVSLPPGSGENQDSGSLPTSPLLLGVRVLVVDDEADSREFITTVLQECHAEVMAVGSVSEALQMIAEWKPDVLVGDIGMPEEDGYSLIRKVRSQPPEQGGKIPAAALTAYARAEERMRAIQSGYQLHLPKPIEPAELATVVASLVGRT